MILTGKRRKSLKYLYHWDRKIYIDNRENTSDLDDYQVKIEITDTNTLNKMKDNAEDIRFYAGTTRLSYWIEEKTPSKLVVWVKIPYIPGSGYTFINMIFGNVVAESESDGEKVFEFFEDFDPDKRSWTVLSGTWSNEAGYEGNSKRGVHDGTTGARKTLAGEYIDLADFILHVKMRCTVSGSLANVIYRAQTNGNDDNDRLWARIDYREGTKWYGFYLIKDEGGTETVTSISGSPQLNQWYDVMIKVHGDTHELYVDGNFIISQTTTITSAGYILLQVEDKSGDDAWFDNIFIRKYTDPEPSVSVEN